MSQVKVFHILTFVSCARGSGNVDIILNAFMQRDFWAFKLILLKMETSQFWELNYINIKMNLHQI